MQPLPVPVALAVAGIGGILTNAAFPYHSWWWAGIAGLGLLFLALHGARAGRGFLLGLVIVLLLFAVITVLGRYVDHTQRQDLRSDQ